MRIEIRNNSVLIDGYVNAVARDSHIMLDDNGERFIEQIKPKVFQRAIEKSDDITCLLNHEDDRVLGSTKQGNIELFEDNIGLRAICKISDSEIIEKAKNEKLRGWSFGFEDLKHSEELIKDDKGNDSLKRRFVEDMNLFEISIIDEKRIPCYVGTSIQTRARIPTKIQYRSMLFKPKIFQIDGDEARKEDQNISKTQKDKSIKNRSIDYSIYENIIKNFGGSL